MKEESTLFLSSLESAIKRKSSACIFFYKQINGWMAQYADATEVCFCTGLRLKINRRHLSDEPTSIFVPVEKIDWVIDRLICCGNPVAMIDTQTGEIWTHWPTPLPPPVEEERPDHVEYTRLPDENELPPITTGEHSLFDPKQETLAGFSLLKVESDVPF